MPWWTSPLMQPSEHHAIKLVALCVFPCSFPQFLKLPTAISSVKLSVYILDASIKLTIISPYFRFYLVPLVH